MHLRPRTIDIRASRLRNRSSARNEGGSPMYRRLLARAMPVLALLLVVPSAAGAATHAPAWHTPGWQGRGIQHIVVIYEENHSFDNLYGGWERVNGLSQRRPGAHHPDRIRPALPYSCLKQNDVNLTSPPLARDLPDARRARPFASHFTNSPFPIDSYIPPTATTCPPIPARPSQPNGVPNGTGPARRLHARPRAPLLPGAVPARRRQAEPLRDRQRRGRPDDGLLRHEAAADLPVPARRRATRTTRSPTTSSRARSAARSSTTSG